MKLYYTTVPLLNQILMYKPWLKKCRHKRTFVLLMISGEVSKLIYKEITASALETLRNGFELIKFPLNPCHCVEHLTPPTRFCFWPVIWVTNGGISFPFRWHFRCRALFRTHPPSHRHASPSTEAPSQRFRFPVPIFSSLCASELFGIFYFIAIIGAQWMAVCWMGLCRSHLKSH